MDNRLFSRLDERKNLQAFINTKGKRDINWGILQIHFTFGAALFSKFCVKMTKWAVTLKG